MDFQLSEEQTLIQQSTKEIAEEFSNISVQEALATKIFVSQLSQLGIKKSASPLVQAFYYGGRSNNQL